MVIIFIRHITERQFFNLRKPLKQQVPLNSSRIGQSNVSETFQADLNQINAYNVTWHQIRTHCNVNTVGVWNIAIILLNCSQNQVI